MLSATSHIELEFLTKFLNMSIAVPELAVTQTYNFNLTSYPLTS